MVGGYLQALALWQCTKGVVGISLFRVFVVIHTVTEGYPIPVFLRLSHHTTYGQEPKRAKSLKKNLALS